MNNTNYSVPILLNNTINPIFTRVNSLILTQFVEEFKLLSSVELKKKKLKELWQTVYQATILEDSNTWYSILFENDQNKTMFLLKHSML